MHATQRALLKAIAASPHDDAPRLVYADWLDEYAAELSKKERESTAARAEIIRVQCELARLADEDCDSRWVYEYLNSHSDEANACVDWSVVDTGIARRMELQVRANQLSASYSDTWRTAETPEIEGVSFYLHRGFWTDVSLYQRGPKVGDILKIIRQQPNLIPLRLLYCERQLTAQDAGQLARSAWFSHLSFFSGGLERPFFSTLGKSPIAAGVRGVFLQPDGDRVTLPFSQKSWSGLRELQVMMHGEQGHLTSIEQLARAKHLAEIHTISIDLDGWSWLDTAHALAGGVWKNLRRLHYEAFLVGDSHANAIAKGTAMSELRYLHLGREVGSYGATAVLKSATLKKLVVLVLRGNEPGTLDAAALGKANRPNLRVLDLPVSSKADLLALAKSPITHNLQILKPGTGIADGATKAFFRAMRMPQLTMLSLAGNSGIGAETAEAIASCDQLANLQALNLMWTKIGNAGAKALAKSKHLNKLRHLDVSQAGVAAAGLAALRKRFGEEVVRG